MIELPEQEPVDTLPLRQPDLLDRLWLLLKRPFSAPRLPWVLIALLLLIVATDITFSLIDQPIDYWQGYPVSYTGIQTLLSLGPLLSILLALIYLVGLTLVLRLFTRSTAFVLWMILCFYHFRDLMRTAECGFPGLFQLDGRACQITSLVLPIILTALIGLILARVLFPSGKLIAIEPRFPRKAAGLAVIWVILLLLGLVSAVRLPNRGWIPIFTENRPTPRIEGAIAYDSNRQVAVLFGGTTQEPGTEGNLFDNDTWEWDGVNWSHRFPENSPPARRVPGMAYDKGRGVVVLFGGESSDGALNDTWEWDGQEWHAYSPPNRPPVRCCHRLFYDELRGKVVVYGGFSGSGSATIFFNDGWEWDGETWTPIFFDSATPQASNFDIVHDSGRNRNIALLSGPVTWAWEENHWSRVQLTAEVPYRNSFRLAYTPVEAQVVLFGGLNEDVFMNDTWLFDGQSWNELEVSRPPTGRWGHVMFYDDVRQRIILFGGYDGVAYRNDMWELVISD